MFTKALAIIREYHPSGAPRVSYTARDGQGCAATEAPRGLLYHRYVIGADGLVKHATIIPPTSQNQAQIEHDLGRYLAPVLHEDDSQLASRGENLVRSYDPCISCSTHFLKLNVDRG